MPKDNLSKEKTPKDNKPVVPSVHAAMRILRFLQKQNANGMTLSEISRALELNKSTCLNILKEMQAFNMISLEETTKRYRLGYSLIALGVAASKVTRWLDFARPVADELHKATGLTTLVAQRIGDRLVVVEELESLRNIHVVVPQGVPLHLTTGALGKCYLAFLPEERSRELIERLGLPKFTAYTITERPNLDQEFARTREQGYAESYSEYAEGVNAIAAPIFDPGGELVLILAIAGFSTTMPPLLMRSIGQQVRDAAARITRRIRGDVDEAEMVPKPQNDDLST